MMWDFYSVKTLFKVEAIGKPKNVDKNYTENSALFEERIILVKARTFDEAINKAEIEAAQYVSNYNSVCRINKYEQSLKLKYLEACDAFLLYNSPESMKEVYSKTFIFNNTDDDKFIDMHLGPPDDAKKNKFMNKQYYEKYWKSKELKNE